MNLKNMHIILAIFIASHQTANAMENYNEGAPQMPKTPATITPVDVSHIQFGDPIDALVPNEPYYLIRVSPEQYMQLYPHTDFSRWTWATEGDLRELQIEMHKEEPWKAKQHEHDQKLYQQLYAINAAIAATAKHKEHTDEHKKACKRKTYLDGEINTLLSRIPADVQAHIQDYYSTIQELVQLRIQQQCNEKKLGELNPLVSHEEYEASLKELRRIWGEPDTFIFRNPTLLKDAIEEKRKRTNNPSAELTREEFMQSILADKFFFAYEHCQNRAEYDLMDQVFASLAKKLLTPEAPTTCSAQKQEMSDQAQALERAKIHLETATNLLANLTQENCIDPEKVTTTIKKLQQSLRIMEQAFPKNTHDAHACVSSVHRPIATSDDFDLIEEDGEYSNPNSRQQYNSFNQGSSSSASSSSSSSTEPTSSSQNLMSLSYWGFSSN